MSDPAPGAGLDATSREFASGQKVFGRYTLVKILGRGGMGIVWLAQDEKLEREVALKFLPDLIIHDRALLDDLKRETRRSLDLTHKNIVRIYDFVDNERSACISMEYIDGETLSNLRAEKEQKVFEPNEIAAWIGQLCDALDYAHNHAKIIHRDLKPANLMVNKKGDLKVSDFGIARSLGDTVSRLTMEQGRSGTLVYMSPQQLEGTRGTHFDDIYSLGATLYDLLTGKPPFYSGNIDRQIHERVAPSMTERRKEFNIEPALVPPVWEETVAACLAKNPASRPQSTAEVANRLQLSLPQIRTLRTRVTRPLKKIAIIAGVAGACLIAIAAWYFTKSKARVQTAASVSSTPAAQAAAVSQKSIAVLPFENLSTEEQNAVFAGGVHREVLLNLAKIADLKVISRTSVMRYKPGTDRNIKQIADELGVSYVVEGSVQREAGHVRVNVELIDARTDTHAWAESYDGNVADVLAFQSEIAQRITNQLGAKLSPRESTELAGRPTHDIAAFESYIRARALMEIPDPDRDDDKLRDDYTRAVQFIEQAVARDPKFASAYWALSEANIKLFGYSDPPNPEFRSRAEAALKEAQRIAPEAGETLHAQARVIYYGYHDFPRALATLERAAKLLPNSAEVTLTRAFLYRRFGRWQEAYAQFERATELNPQDPTGYYSAADIARGLRWWDEADRVRARLIKLFPRLTRQARLEEMVSLRQRGEVDAGNKLMETFNLDVRTGFVPLFYRSFWKRDYQECRRLLAEAAKYPDLERDRWEKELKLAFATKTPGPKQAALEAEKQLEERLRHTVTRDEGELTDTLSCVKFILGKKEEAVRLCEQSVEKHPLSEDALVNGDRVKWLAYAYIYAGDHERALQSFAKLVQTPFGEYYGPLNYEPVFDELRKDPRFDEILKQSQKPFPRL